MAIITISTGAFSDREGLAERVAEKLGYRCLSTEVLAEGARQYGVPQGNLSEALTKRPGILERLATERSHYLACIRAVLCKEARDDDLVYHGHAGHLLLRGVPRVLRVRVIADMEFRIEAAKSHHGLSREEAIQFIKRADDERARWTRFVYNVDWHGPSLYDLVINLDKISLSGACELVCCAVSSEEYQPTPWWHKTMNDVVLGTHIRAMLAGDKSIGDAGLDVEADNGLVTISGMVEWAEDIGKIDRLVARVPGVRDVNLEVRLRSSWGDVEGLRIR